MILEPVKRGFEALLRGREESLGLGPWLLCAFPLQAGRMAWFLASFEQTALKPTGEEEEAEFRR